jgi:hypothetical protein
MTRTAAFPAMLAAMELLSSTSSIVRAQDALSIANNDSIFIDSSTFRVSPGKAKGDVAAQIKKLGARELGPGAIVFRASDKLYIIDADVTQEFTVAYDSARPYAYDPGDPRRFMYDQHSDPRRFAYDPSGGYTPSDPSRPYQYDPSNPRRFAVDPARPYAYNPGDPRRFAYDPSDPRCAQASSNDPQCPLIYNPDRHAVYINDPDYAQYRLKKAFEANWTTVSARP